MKKCENHRAWRSLRRKTPALPRSEAGAPALTSAGQRHRRDTTECAQVDMLGINVSSASGNTAGCGCGGKGKHTTCRILLARTASLRAGSLSRRDQCDAHRGSFQLGKCRGSFIPRLRLGGPLGCVAYKESPCLKVKFEAGAVVTSHIKCRYPPGVGTGGIARSLTNSRFPIS